MKIRDIVELAAVLLQKHEIINTGIFAQTESRDWVEAELNGNRELRLIIRCANLVLKEVACEYIPLYHKQNMVSHDGKINYSDFEKSLLEIKKIKNKYGNEVRYFTLPDYVAVEDGNFEVSYAFIPDDKGFFDEIDFSGTKACDRLFAYGTAAEFCLISGMYEDALMWEKRYKDALLVATRKTGEKVMPKRRWW